MKLILIIFLSLSSIIQYAPQAIAQTKNTTTTKQPAQPSRKPPARQEPPARKKPRSQPVFVPPKVPKGLTPVPGRRRGMGSRNTCPRVPISLTALVPGEELPISNKTGKSTAQIVGGLTTLEKPTFWFYVPYTTQNLVNSSAEFSLQDSRGMDVYRKKAIALPDKPGVIGISLPNTVKSLKIGQTYRWYFKVRCKQQTASLPVYVEGDIQRINLNARVRQQLTAASNPRQKVIIYATEGIWFDALNMLAQLRQSSQNVSVEKDWQILLQSVDLNNIDTAPIVNSPL